MTYGNDRQQKLAENIRNTHPAPGEILIWWLGQSGFVLRTAEVCIVTDPYLSTTLEDATRDQPWKRHVRMMPIALPPEALDCVDYIVCSHGHRDHCDPPSILGILRGSPQAKVIVPPAVTAQMEWLPKENTVSVGVGDLYEGGTLSVTAIPAKHNQFDWTEEYGYPYVGYILHFGDLCIYHAGDTILHDDLPRLLAEEKPDIAIVPINGGTPELVAVGFQSNLNGQEAADLCRSAGVKLMIPCHYDMFTINTAPAETFTAYADSSPEMPPYAVPEVGTPIRFRR